MGQAPCRERTVHLEDNVSTKKLVHMKAIRINRTLKMKINSPNIINEIVGQNASSVCFGWTLEEMEKNV